MSELFKKEYTEAEEKLYKKGYYISNMESDSNYYEIANGNGKTLIDNLSLAQLIALSNML